MGTHERDLIRDYSDAGSQSAFRELVDRHVDLVYSAARRQVRSPDLADEVTQSVFIALSRNVHQLKPGTPLLAWLFLVTRRTSIDVMRGEARRKVREHTAYEIASMKPDSTGWSQVEPVLDEAMESLADVDRSAILLRYFENSSLRDVGRVLGISDDAAQKRVSRALDQIRVFLSKRGVTVSAAALATNLSVGAVQSAPIGLGLTISSAAAVGAGITMPIAVVGAAKTLAMTSLQKGILATTFAAVIGAGFYEERALSRRDDQIFALTQQVEQARAENRRLIRERNESVGALAAYVQQEKKPSGLDQPAGESATDAELRAVSARVSVLKERLTLDEQQQIPEQRLLSETDWVQAATGHRLETEEDIREALANLRGTGKVHFSAMLSRALWSFAEANGGLLPSDTAQLAPYLEPPAEASWLTRYGMMRTGKLREIGARTVVLAEIATVDGNQETTLYMTGPRSQPNAGDTNIHAGASSDISGIVLRAVADYLKSKPEPLTDYSQLQPFLSTPVDTARLQKFWRDAGLPDNLRSPSD